MVSSSVADAGMPAPEDQWQGVRMSRRLQLDLRDWRVNERREAAAANVSRKPFKKRIPWQISPVLQTWSRRANNAKGQKVVRERVAIVDRRGRGATGTRALGEALFAHLKVNGRPWCRDVLVWAESPGRLWVRVEVDEPDQVVAEDGLEAFLETLVGTVRNVMVRVIVVSADAAAPWEGRLPLAMTYHRILAWHNDLPPQVPKEDAPHLVPGLVRDRHGHAETTGAGEPWFGAYTAVVSASERLNVEAAPALANLWAAEPKDSPSDDTNDQRPAQVVLQVLPAIQQLLRDLARPGFWLQDLFRIGVNVSAWALDRLPGGTPVMAGPGFRSQDGLHRVLRDHVRAKPGDDGIVRVARALRFERVGWAIGGGGAVSFRALLPMEALLADDTVGMDLIAGISGGSVVASIVAGGGVAALRGAVQDGPAFSKAAWTFALGDRARFDAWIHKHAGTAHLGLLNVPCYPLAVRLRAKREVDTGRRWILDPLAQRPTLAAFVHWALGDAVLSSGCAPPTLPPMLIDDADGRNVFIDGGLDVMVPCRALPDLGADYVVGVSGFNAGYNARAGAYLVNRARGRGAHSLAAILLGVEGLLDGASGDADAFLTPPEQADVALLTEARRFGALDELTRAGAWPGLKHAVSWVKIDHARYILWQPTDG